MRERGEDTFEPSCHLERETISHGPVYQVSPEHPFGIWKPDEMKQTDLSFSFILPPSLPLPDLTGRPIPNGSQLLTDWWQVALLSS